MGDSIPTATIDRSEASSQAIFQREWQVYRTLVDQNYLFHREAYACLHQLLVEEVPYPFRFLDIACGDASASVAALAGTCITHYDGIDLSAAALALARDALTVLRCPVTLEQADFVEALRVWSTPVDVAWIGLSLHHLMTAQKLAVMRDIRRILKPGGRFLLYEDASPDGETREEWLRRWDAQGPFWPAFTPDELAIVNGHVHAADFPETVSGWLSLAAEAGFDEVREVFIAPSNLLRLYAMRAATT
jgi:SAM-dependent methyltransferase